MTNLEDQIIAYLDGTLDESSRAELLHVLSVSPEKRKLLEEHIKLREIISLGHKPQPVPLVTERRLADRIPILMQELPYLAEKSTRLVPVAGIRSTSYLGAASRYVSGFFTSRFAPAVGLGTLALVGGLTWYFASSSHEDAQPVASLKSPVHQERVSGSASDRSLNTEGTTNIVAQPDTRNSVSHERTSQAETNAVRHSRVSESRISDTRMIDSRVNGNVVSNDAVENSDRGMRSNDPVTPVDNPVNPPLQEQVQHAENNVSTPPANLPSANVPPANIPSADIRSPEIDPTPLPLPSEKESATGKWFIQGGMASDVNFRPNQVEQVYEVGAGKTFPTIGGGYSLTPHIAIGVEAGMSSLSQQNEETNFTSNGAGSMQTPLSEVNRMEHKTNITDVDAIWTQAILRYTLNPEDQFNIEATGGAGAAYVDGLAPMVSLGIGGTYAVADNLDLTMGATLRGAWLSEMGEPSGSDPFNTFEGPVAVVSNRASSSTVFTSAVSGRIGLRFGF